MNGSHLTHKSIGAVACRRRDDCCPWTGRVTSPAALVFPFRPGLIPVPAPKLPLEDMDRRHYGLTPATAAYYHQCARVCLDRHHQPPTEFHVEDEAGALPVEVAWAPTSSRERAAQANRDDATRDAGYLCVLAATELRDSLYAISRVQVGGRADYYVAPAGAPVDDLEQSLRLEVSGVDAGDRGAVARRLTEKIDQVTSVGNLPAMAGVIGFAAKTIMLRHLTDGDQS